MAKDLVCPIACGKCCEECPHLDTNGCDMPRNQRPSYCLSFTCEVCDDVRKGRITCEEGLEAVREKWGSP